MTKKQTTKKTNGSVLRHHLRRTFVPHKGNQYRPHLVRLHGITAVLVLVVAIQLIYGFATSGRLEVLGRVSDISVSDLLADTNDQRKQSSLSELKLNDQLSAAAFLKAKDMFTHNYWAHVSPEGVTPWKWIGDAGYNYDVAGENLAKNYPSSKETLNAWMGSRTHRANILNGEFQDVGFAVVDGILDGRSTTIIVAYYGTPATVVAVEGAEDAKASPVYAAPVSKNIGSPIAYFGTALQSLTPATLGSIALLFVLAVVAFVAHTYRHKLPTSMRRTWKRHHGMFTVIGAVSLALIAIVATGGGQI